MNSTKISPVFPAYVLGTYTDRIEYKTTVRIEIDGVRLLMPFVNSLGFSKENREQSQQALIKDSINVVERFIAFMRYESGARGIEVDEFQGTERERLAIKHKSYLERV